MDTRIGISKVVFDGNGVPDHLQKLATALHGTDGFPTLFGAESGLFMAWQGKHNPPSLGLSKFLPPSSQTDFLLPGLAWYPQFSVKTRPSIAIIGNTPYVAFEEENFKSSVAVFSEDGRSLRGIYTSESGYRWPSIAAFDEKLFLACYGTSAALSLLQVTLDHSGIPQGFATQRTSVLTSDVGPILITTPTELLIGWLGKRGSNLNIGVVI
jgi:hypothetical protein